MLLYPMEPLYIPADYALWLYLESGADENDADASYLRSLGAEMILITDPNDERTR